MKTVKDIALEYSLRIWDKKDLSAIDELMSSQVVIHSLLGDFYGTEAMKNVVEAWLRAFPDLRVQNQHVVAENNLVMIHWKASGSHLGVFKGVPPTGKTVSYAGATLFEIQNDKIAQYWAYLDINHILSQIQ